MSFSVMLYVLSGFLDYESNGNSCFVDERNSEVCLLCFVEYVRSGLVGYFCKWNVFYNL